MLSSNCIPQSKNLSIVLPTDYLLEDIGNLLRKLKAVFYALNLLQSDGRHTRRLKEQEFVPERTVQLLT